MDEQLTAAAKTLARWCYQRGVDEQILDCGPPLLRSAVDQALVRSTPPPSEDALRRQTAALLHQRRAWDREHQVSPPPPAECLFCAIDRGRCPTHVLPRCRACGGQLHRIVVEEGFDTHPCCDRPRAGTHADLEVMAQLLGATPLPNQPPEHRKRPQPDRLQ